MDLGIIGLPASGKTSLWNALTGGAAEVGAYSGRLEPRVGAVRVPDARVDRLAELYHSKKRTHAEIRWIDYPVAAFESSGPDAKLLGELAQMDALVLVARAFEAPSVAAPAGGVDPQRDVETVELELTYADLALIERRLGRIEPELRSMRAGDRGPLEQEQALLRRWQAGLEEGVALRSQELSEAERRQLSRYPLLTRRPLLVVLNVGEEDLARAAEIEAEFAARQGGASTAVLALSAKLEAEVAALDAAEAAEFRRELGAAGGVAGRPVGAAGVRAARRALVHHGRRSGGARLDAAPGRDGAGGGGADPLGHGARLHPRGGRALGRAAQGGLAGRAAQAGPAAYRGPGLRGRGRRCAAGALQRLTAGWPV